MMLVPMGCFRMGSTGGSTGININQQPEHEQCINEPFWIDKTEVTNEQFLRLEGEAAAPSESRFETYPRDTIMALEAIAFCTRRGARLISEPEWEYAARGPDNLIYPWGNAWNEEYAVWEGNSVRRRASEPRSRAGGSYPQGASWVGALDLSGNVWEWTRSIDADYSYNANDGRENNNNIRSFRILRGGSWANQPELMTTSFRLRTDITLNDALIGFRCMRRYEG